MKKPDDSFSSPSNRNLIACSNPRPTALNFSIGFSTTRNAVCPLRRIDPPPLAFVSTLPTSPSDLKILPKSSPLSAGRHFPAQTSNQLRPCADSGNAEFLRPFCEPVYLHQTKSAPRMARYAPMPIFRTRWNRNRPSRCREWRTHFHVPLYFGHEGLSAPPPDCSRRFSSSGTRIRNPYFEIETYTMAVLPLLCAG
jgi:hypothetical protein